MEQTPAAAAKLNEGNIRRCSSRSRYTPFVMNTFEQNLTPGKYQG
jgi:hypothetical protein